MSPPKTLQESYIRLPVVGGSSHSPGPGPDGGAKRVVLYGLAAASVLFLLYVGRSRSPQSLVGAAGRLHGAPVDSRIEEAPGECNPFKKAGYLQYNATSAMDNIWVPFGGDTKDECGAEPSQLFKALRDDLQRLYRGQHGDDGTRALPWLRNRTVVLLGDSIDRFHLRDFCDLLGASLSPAYHDVAVWGTDPSPSVPQGPSISYPIWADSPLSPPPYRPFPRDPTRPPVGWPAGEEEQAKWNELRTKWEEKGEIQTRPWVCEVPSYGLMLVSTFTFGLEPKQGGHVFAGFPWYFPPATYVDRLEHLLLPTLRSLASAFSRPHTLQPDLIELSSGLWDMRQWTEEDFAAAGMPLDEDSPIPYAPLSADRLSWWAQRVEAAIRAVASAFPDRTTPILWRSLHHPKRHYYAPWPRVAQLDDLGRWIVERLRDGGEGWGRERLRVDEWGARMIGQEHHFRDILHPSAVPGGVLWGDIMLWELKRAVERKGGVE